MLEAKDVATRYAVPDQELRRWAKRGVLRPVARGYWVLPPLEAWSDPGWRPSLEAVAAGLAVTAFGPENAALMGPSAARILGALPRAHAVAVVAVPKQRRRILTAFGPVIFVKRDVTRLDLARRTLDLGTALSTTPEQTLLDIAARPTLGDLTEQEATAVQATLARTVDWDHLRDLARVQRRMATLLRLETLAAQG